jgi:hypothetical protein
VLQHARERFSQVETAESAWREHYRHDTAFAAGDQWESSIARARKEAPGGARVVLTLNQLPKFERIVENDERQNRATIRVTGVDQGADRETASVLNRLIRHIHYDSDADDAYDTAFNCMVRGGKGFWRIVTEYESAWSFQQVLKIKRILSPLSVYLDPLGRQDLDYHSANYGFVVERQSRDHVQQRYEIATSMWDAWLGQRTAWVSKDECLVADYYCRETLPVTLAMLRTGDVRYVPILTETDDDSERQRQQEILAVLTHRLARERVLPLQPGEEGQVQRTRQSLVSLIWWYKTNGHALLERTLWPGDTIPLIPVLGAEYSQETGSLDYQGIVRHSIGAQQLFNFARSMAAETIALAPKAPYIGAAGQFRGFEDQWRTLNTQNWAYVEYTPQSLDGSPVPPPQRLVQEPAIAGVTAFAQQVAQDLNETMGIYQAALGAPSVERSGIAIQRRKAQSQLGTAHLTLNMQRAQRAEARQLLDLIPFVYHEPGRVLRIIGEDQSATLIALQPGLARPQTQSSPEAPLPPGVAGIYDLSAGRYDVILQPGPNYQTQREETAAVLTNLAQAMPTLGAVIPDLLIDTQDFPGREEAVRRLRKTLPPGLLEPESGQRPEDQVAVLQSQLQEVQGAMQQLQQQLQAMQGVMQQQAQEHAKTTQENTQLKLRLEAKGGELALKDRELALKERQQLFEEDLRMRQLVQQERHFQQERLDKREDNTDEPERRTTPSEED